MLSTRPQLDAPTAHLNWTNAHGGPLVYGGDIFSQIYRAPSPPPFSRELRTAHGSLKPSPFHFVRYPGFLAAGNDIEVINVTSTQAALDACTADIECRGLCYSGNATNGTITHSTKVFLKRRAAPCVESTRFPVCTEAGEEERATLGLGGRVSF